MKKILLQQGKLLSVLIAAFVLVFAVSIAAARGTAKVSDEKKLKTEISSLNKAGSMPNGDKIVMDELTKEFDVKSEEVTALRDKDLAYGEIAAVYAFADKMSGGVNDENVNRVTSLQQGKKGWGKIASELDVDLGDVTKKISSIGKSVREEIKQASAGKSGKGAGGGSDERKDEKDRSDLQYQ
jgi:hypothetical protein